MIKEQSLNIYSSQFIKSRLERFQGAAMVEPSLSSKAFNTLTEGQICLLFFRVCVSVVNESRSTALQNILWIDTQSFNFANCYDDKNPIRFLIDNDIVSIVHSVDSWSEDRPFKTSMVAGQGIKERRPITRRVIDDLSISPPVVAGAVYHQQAFRA